MKQHPGRCVAVALAALASFALAACEDDEDGSTAPTNAAVADFCDVVGSLDTSDPAKLVDQMLEVGTPEGIPGEARDGFEVMIEQADAESISDGDQEKVTAFVLYVTETCA